ncbi:MAG: TatD family hydrolase [Chloroflexi bacterium]|nr:TatD family hydrolase [Chloroflexota bacterium]MBT7079890.1 TatD family hydrolase [Chloroflexota bacterium]MBT7290127.1 TatD family hydrolase [Chloroflexota bacterium]
MLIEAHCHLNAYARKSFGGTLAPVIQEIERNKILTMANSMDFTSYKINKRIGRMCGYVIPSFGIHPWNAYKYTGKLDMIREMIRKTRIIGEIGLDHLLVKDASRYPAQQEIFELFLSESADRMLSVHSRGTDQLVLDLLKKYGSKRVVMHSYAGPLDILKKLIEQGYYFSIGPKVNLSEKIQEIVRTIPLDQLLTETDNPGGSATYTSKKPTPLFVRQVVEGIAECKNVPADDVEAQVESNFIKLSYGIIPASVFGSCRG